MGYHEGSPKCKNGKHPNRSLIREVDFHPTSIVTKFLKKLESSMEGVRRLVTKMLCPVSFLAPAAEATPCNVGWAVAVELWSNREPQNHGWAPLPATIAISG